MLPLFFLLAFQADAIAPGRVIDRVQCSANSDQTYSLYLPSAYDPKRAWPVIFAFDAGGRGRTPVERYRAAAEKYGYIVAGSNNSRNGPVAVSFAAADAMTRDVSARFSLDGKRVYLAGMSGGSRVALEIAQSANGGIAGVVASSAGFMDSKVRNVPFAIFGTAGTEDFNYLEMRQLDKSLSSPHHLAVFEGGHTWLPEATAVSAVEWLELQAMKSGRKAPDAAEIEEIFRKYEAVAAGDGLEALHAAQSGTTDFAGLHDVSGLAQRAALLGKDKKIHEAEKRDRDDLDREQRLNDEVLGAERRLKGDERSIALSELRSFWKRLAAAADGPEDTPERRRARRVLRGMSMGAAERVDDPDYRKMLAAYRQRPTGAQDRNVK